jgi:hypothetical protein
MTDSCDPSALVRHAVQAGDWRLVELLAGWLAQRSTRPADDGMRRTYDTLVIRLGLSEPGVYHHP